jgi:adenylate cyclase
MNATLSVDDIRGCLDGAIPTAVATCAPDGTPNVSLVSQVFYVDEAHVALSYQFFNKTRQNVLATRRAKALAIDPLTIARYRLSLDYVRTEVEGPLFERMKAHLAGIASHTGMAGVFRLQGADVYRVRDIDPVPCVTLPEPAGRRNLLAGVRGVAQRVGGSADLAHLFDETLLALEANFGIRYAMLLMADPARELVYTVATRGYATSGVGSEIAFGAGVIGVAARERTSIRIMHATNEWGYGRAIRESAADGGLRDVIATEIPLPGLSDSRSQLAVPLLAGGALVGVLFVEDVADRRFGYDDEDALLAIAGLLGPAIRGLQACAEDADDTLTQRPGQARVLGPALKLRHYSADDSIFFDDDYLIKGVAGAILWKLVGDYARAGRTDFTNRELRLDPAIRLPDLFDNLEARLILLQRRLAERSDAVRIEKTGRGRFRLCVQRPVDLHEIAAGARAGD